MTVYLAQVDLANPAARQAHVVEPRTSGCDRRTDSRIEKQFAACVPNLDHLASAGRDMVVSCGTRRLHGRLLDAWTAAMLGALIVVVAVWSAVS